MTVQPSKQLAQVVGDAGFEDFGFLVIRTAYGEESVWEQWAEKFNNMIESSVMEHAGAGDVINKLMMAMIDDEELQGASWTGVQIFFDDCKESDMVPPGADVGFCLAVDQEAMNSLLHPKADEDPWVWAVDTEYDFEDTEAQNAANAYPGFFKVAVTSVVTQFWPTIAGSEIIGAELQASAQPIWKHAS